MKHSVTMLLLLVGCSPHDESEPADARAMVVKPPQDTTRFTTPATVRRCHDGRSLLFEAVGREGSGVLIRIKYGDSLAAGSYPVIWPDDTAAQRGATVAVRYVVREVANSFALDSGTVDLDRNGNKLGARVIGRGVENAIRMFATADVREIPLAADTASCRYQQ